MFFLFLLGGGGLLICFYQNVDLNVWIARIYIDSMLNQIDNKNILLCIKIRLYNYFTVIKVYKAKDGLHEE